MVCNSYVDIKNAVSGQLINVIANKCADKFYDILENQYKEFVTDFYSEYTPTIYERTLQLRDVLPIKITPKIVGNTITCGIDLSDISRVHYVEDERSIIEAALLDASHGGVVETDTAPYKELEKWVKEHSDEFIEVLKSELKKNGMFIVS